MASDEFHKSPKYSDSPYAPDWAKPPELRAEKPAAALSLGENDDICRPDVDQFETLLWSDADDDVRVYAIMDGYWAKGLYGRLRAHADLSWAHMFQGGAALRHLQDAPFLIALKRGHALTRWLIKEGWGRGWGIYFTASTREAQLRYGETRQPSPMFAPSNEEEIRLGNLTEGLEDPLWLMRTHFRRFSMVEFEGDARLVRFRYFDPGTLRTYLPTCNNRELFKFVGPVKVFYAEGYSAVESLNAPRHIYRFRAWPDRNAPLPEQARIGDPAMVFEGIGLDFETRQKWRIERAEIAKGSPDRDASAYPLIRSAQEEAFCQASWGGFAHQCQRNVQDLCEVLKISSPRNVNAFTALSIDKALAAGLQKESEMIKFVLCTLLLGDNFQTSSSGVRNGLSSSSWLERDECLQTIFDDAFINYGRQPSSGPGVNEPRGDLYPLDKIYRHLSPPEKWVQKNIAKRLEELDARAPMIMGKDGLERYAGLAVILSKKLGIIHPDGMVHYAYLGLFLGLYFSLDFQYDFLDWKLNKNAFSSRKKIRFIDEEIRKHYASIAGKKQEYFMNSMSLFMKYDINEMESVILSRNGLEELSFILWKEKAEVEKPVLKKVITVAAYDAKSAGYTSEHDIALFSIFGFVLGRGFYHDPHHGWVRKLIDRDRNVQPAERFFNVLDVTKKFIAKEYESLGQKP